MDRQTEISFFFVLLKQMESPRLTLSSRIHPPTAPLLAAGPQFRRIRRYSSSCSSTAPVVVNRPPPTEVQAATSLSSADDVPSKNFNCLERDDNSSSNRMDSMEQEIQGSATENKHPEPSSSSSVGRVLVENVRDMIERYAAHDRVANEEAFRRWLSAKRSYPPRTRRSPTREVVPSSDERVHPDPTVTVKEAVTAQAEGELPLTKERGPSASMATQQSPTTALARELQVSSPAPVMTKELDSSPKPPTTTTTNVVVDKEKDAERARRKKKKAAEAYEEWLQEKTRAEQEQQRAEHEQQLKAQQKAERDRQLNEDKRKKAEHAYRCWLVAKQEALDARRQATVERKQKEREQREMKHQKGQEAMERWLRTHPASVRLQERRYYPHKERWKTNVNSVFTKALLEEEARQQPTPNESMLSLQSPPSMFRDAFLYAQLTSPAFQRKYRLLIASAGAESQHQLS